MPCRDPTRSRHFSCRLAANSVLNLSDKIKKQMDNCETEARTNCQMRTITVSTSMILKQFAHMRTYRHRSVSQFAAKTLGKMRRCSHFQVSIRSGRGQARSLPSTSGSFIPCRRKFLECRHNCQTIPLRNQKSGCQIHELSWRPLHSNEKGGTRVDHD